MRNWRIVKVATTKPQRKLFFKLRSSKKRLGWFSQDEVNDVAKTLGVKPETVVEMESRLSASDVTFDPPTNDNDDEHHFTPAAYLTDGSMDPAHLLEHDDNRSQELGLMSSSLETLDERSQDILKQRWLSDSKSTLHDLAAQYGVSAERIRQLEKNAMKKLKVAVVLES